MSQPAQTLPVAGTFSPSDLSLMDPVASTPVADVASFVAKARAAGRQWNGLPLSERTRRIEALAREILSRHEEICDIVSRETGKSPQEVLLSEVSGVAEYSAGAIKEAKVALKPVVASISKVVYPGKKAVTEPIARGVIGIIAPWNYPLSIFYKPLFPALLAGNGVVLKPSEFTPRTGAWLAEVCCKVLMPDLVQVVQGRGDVGAALIESGIDGLTFTGSVPTGRKIAARAGELLIPVSVELGGKDAAIVLADCDMERTLAGVAQWATHNCGQNCAGIERVYVEAAIADEFVERLGKIFDKLRVAPEGAHCELGPLQNHAQLAIVEDHVKDAVDKGAKLVAGGKRTGPGLGFRPTVLDRCTHAMKVVTDETFGPVLAVIRVADADEAVRLANDCVYGLNGSVWTKDLRRGEAIARQLEVGVALVNNHSVTGIFPQLPWTGVKDTGPGVAASRFSYSTFARPRTVLVDSNSKPDPWWIPANEDTAELGKTLVAFSTGSLGAVLTLAKIAGRRVKAIQALVRESKS
jgi:acyl-CoA reductase-like NAD-dependent aldehyde dehydrogenase